MVRSDALQYFVDTAFVERCGSGQRSRRVGERSEIGDHVQPVGFFGHAAEVHVHAGRNERGTG